jgi:hypothetical protein
LHTRGVETICSHFSRCLPVLVRRYIYVLTYSILIKYSEVVSYDRAIIFSLNVINCRQRLVCLGVKFLKLELNFYSLCGFRDKEICLGVEFLRLKKIIF